MILSGISAAFALILAGAPTADAAMSEKDDFGYMYVDSKDPAPKVEYDWIDASDGGTKVSISGDDSTATVPLPFPFPFYGQTFNHAYPNTNGLLGLSGSFYHYSNQNIPCTSPSGFIAVYWDDTSMVYGGSMYYITGTNQYGVEYICIEWIDVECPLYASGPNYAITYEVILFKDGMIKLQYKDVTSARQGKGQSATVGIDAPTGSDGVLYSYNTGVLEEGLAIMFGSTIAEVKSVDLETEEGGVFYAMHRDYTVKTVVTHPINVDMLKQVSLTFGANYATAFAFLDSGGALFTMVDPEGFIQLDPAKCSVKKNGNELEVTFSFSPTFKYPVNTFQDLVVSTGGVGVMPNTQILEDIYWVETRLTLVGSMVAVSDTVGIIENGGWIRGGERFSFRGLSVVYPETFKSPKPGVVTLTVSDEQGNRWVQTDVDGQADIEVQAENDFVRKTYIINITGVPPGVDISEAVPYILNIDPYRPTPPKEVLIHADSFDDRNTEYDDDNEVFVTWEPAEDFESGIAGYFVSGVDPFEDDAEGPAPVFVESPDTSTKFVFDGMGSRKIWVWSMDKAGNPSVPSYALTKIDATEVTFSEFSPGHQVWVNT
ncbi:MAG: hypothetical protein DRN57_06125, partial [Thermoplasmata archaeon]